MAQLHFNSPAARSHANGLAGCEAHPGHVCAAHRGCGRRLQRVEHRSAARHAAGVPMLQLPPGDQHHRVLGIGLLVGGDQAGRHEPHAAVGGGEMVMEDDGLARIVGTHTGVSDRARVQARPIDAANGRGHGLAHFFVDLGHTFLLACVMPVQAHALGDLLDDPQVGFRIARRQHGLAAHLHRAVGVADGAGFLGPGAGGQHHIGQPGGFGQENVLHHQVLQTGQRVARVVQVRVAHGRVLAHDVHAAHLVRIGVRGQSLVHDFDHGVAGLVVQFRVPELFKPIVR